MRSTYLLILIISIPLPLFSQNGYWQTGAAETGIANATAGYTKDNVLFHNIGALGLAKQSYISAGYDYRGYVEGLNNISLQLVKQGEKRSFGAGFFKSGDEILNEFVASAGVGQKLGIASLGVKLNYYQSYSEAFGYGRVYSISAGGIAEIFPDFFWGTFIDNPVRLSETDINIDLPVFFSTGFTYYPTENIMLAATTAMDVDEPMKVKVGMSYNIIRELSLRTGVNFYYKNFHFGLGLNLKKIRIDYAYSPVVPLGNTHSLTLVLSTENFDE